MACSDFELCILSAGRSMVADAANHWYADAAKNLYVYLADLDVQKCRQNKTKVIIAISKINNNILHSLTIFNQAVYSFIYCCKFFQNDIFRTVTSTGFSNNIWYNPVLWKFVEEEVAGQDIMSNLIKSTVLH